jgi:putative ATP-binding cassette transporter
LSPVYSTQVRSISASILFIIGPLSLIVGVFPMFRRANHAVAQIIELEAHLDRAQPKERERRKAPEVPAPFKEITLDGVTFSYTDRDGRETFSLAPVNLTIRQGETLFIVGGNGSGKSTLLKVLTGLYHPSAGTIFVDGVPVSVYGQAAYRGLFSAIFSDYHLFDRLYGIPNVDDEEVRKDLVEMELNRKTAWQDGRFVNQDLSTGQRKRLALVVSRLEKKPIQLFDEWAADQDPHFRQHFYKDILADMKRAGKTIIAATHDDRYFDVADRVLKMDEGQVSNISAGRSGEAVR